MAGELHEEFPLFPLGLVALPTELVPLHIFEERYQTMVAHCLETSSDFGIVWMAADGLREIGCACTIEQVLERMEHGRSNIVVRGERPFRIIERQSHLPYPAGVVEFLEDELEPLDADLVGSARRIYAHLVEQATDRVPDPAELAGLGAYAMAATVDFGADAKQGLLELRSENARLKLVARLFRAATKRLDFVDRAQTRARSNGKVRFS